MLAELICSAIRSTMTIRDSTGMAVAEREMGPLDVGEHDFKWDGKNDAGNSVSDGLYHFSIYARDIEGNQIEVPVRSKTIISGINVQSDSGDLYTDLGSVQLADIIPWVTLDMMARARPPKPRISF